MNQTIRASTKWKETGLVRYLADCSLSLINRTGAHFITTDIVEGLAGHFAGRRYWRLLRDTLPADPWRKVLGRAMLREIRLLGGSTVAPWPEPTPALPRLFFDPLYVLRSRHAPNDIVLCHDVGPVSHADLFDPVTSDLYKAAYAKIRSVGPRMAFVSGTSRREFERLFGSKYPSLDAISLYIRPGSAEGDDEPVPGVRKPFILTVGAFERRKNLPRSIRGFTASGLAREGYSYVLCGARGLDADAVLQAAASDEAVLPLSYVSDAQLRWLYRNASAFVLPSLLEGFGMPALEACAFGLLPVVSRDGALQEVVGDLGIAVDPLSEASIAEGMRQSVGVALSDDHRTALVERARGATRTSFLSQWDALLSRA